MTIRRLAVSAAVALVVGLLADASSATPQETRAAHLMQPGEPTQPALAAGSAEHLRPATPVQPAERSPPSAAAAEPTAPAQPAAPGRPSAAQVGAAARGRKVFDRYCISCHGVEGDGRGPSADWLDPRPRILTSGIFKFRSTPSGELPTDADLLRTITNGLHSTYMPRWAATTQLERADVAQFVKTLSPRFATEPQGKPIVIPRSPPVTPQLVQKGNEVWDKMQCATCHGETGKGDGASASTLRDDWGFPVLPHDFTHGSLKIGDAPEDLYRTFMTGMNGTPMPSFVETLSPDDAWALVAYVRTLRKD